MSTKTAKIAPLYLPGAFPIFPAKPSRPYGGDAANILIFFFFLGNLARVRRDLHARYSRWIVRWSIVPMRARHLTPAEARAPSLADRMAAAPHRPRPLSSSRR